MFLEKCGKYFFFKMRPLFFFVLILFPLLGASFYIFLVSKRVEELEDRFRSAQKKEKLAFQRKEMKEKFLARYSNPDPYFLDRQIESFHPLTREETKLLSLQNHPAYPESSSLEERLVFIRENKLAFIEDKISLEKEMKETEERQRAPIQVDESDLKKLLCLIEDLPDGEATFERRPQILIKEFRMKKVETPLETETFEVKMDLIKREFKQ